MKKSLLGYALLVTLIGGCGPAVPKPTFVVRGNETTIRSISEVTFDAAGLKLAVQAQCERSDLEYWCSPPTNACQSKRKVVFQCGDSPTSLRTPWGQVYAGTTASIPIPWAQTGIDPLAAEASSALKASWQITSPDGTLNHSFVLSDSVVSSILKLVASAQDAQLPVESPARTTTLEMRFVDSGVLNRLAIQVTNTGGTSADGVSARLATGFSPLHGREIAFGKIGPKQSKTWSQDIFVPPGEENTAPMIVAEVKANNASSITVSARFKFGNALKIECRAVEPKVVPGSKAQVRCKLQNQGKTPLSGLIYETRNGSGKSTAGVGPAEILGGRDLEATFDLPVPSSEKVGTKLAVVAVVKTKSSIVASPPIAIEVVDPSKLDVLKIECRAVEPKVVPGSKAQVRCKLQNQGKTLVNGLTYETRNGSGKPTAGVGPTEISGGRDVEATFDLPVPSSEKVGTKLAVVVVVKTKSSVVASPPVAVEVSDPSKLDALKIACRAVQPKVVPGSKAQVRCKLQNQGKTPVSGLTYETRNGSGKPTAGVGPAEIPGGRDVEATFDLPVPSSEKVGTKLAVVVVVKTKSSVVLSLPVEVEVSSKVLCTKLTKDEYRAKRKELEALVAAGTLTQAELDDYEVELVKCLQ